MAADCVAVHADWLVAHSMSHKAYHMTITWSEESGDQSKSVIHQ